MDKLRVSLRVGILSLLLTLTGWGQESPEVVPPEVRLKSYVQNYNYGGGSSYSGNWYGWTWSGSGGWNGWHNINWNSATGGFERYGGSYSGNWSQSGWGAYSYGYNYDVTTTWPAPPALGTMVYTNSWVWNWPDGQGGTYGDTNGTGEIYYQIPQPGGFPWRFAQTFKYEPYGYGEHDPEGEWWWTNSWSWTLSDSTRTRIDLHTGGATNSTAQSLFVLTVSAYDAETGETVDPTLIQVRGEYADTNGVVALTLNDNGIYDVTPSLPAAYSNYYFYVDNPGALRPRLYMDFDEEMLDLQQDHFTSSATTAAAPPASTNLTYLLGKNDVTSRTFRGVIGQRHTVYVDGIPAGTPVNYQWTISGPYVSDYVMTPSTGQAITNQFETNSTVSCYFLNAGSFSIQCRITVGGKVLPLRTTAVISAPTGNLILKTNDTVRITDEFGQWLRFGNFLYSPYGITFWGTNLVCPLNVDSNKASWAFIQVMDSMTILRFHTNGTYRYVSNLFGLDSESGQVFYPDGPNSPETPAWYGRQTYRVDSPGVKLNEIGEYRVQRNDSFTTYLMFNPKTAGSIYVPVAMGKWKWSGAATNPIPSDYFQWRLGEGSPNVGEVLLQNQRFPFPLPKWTNQAPSAPLPYMTTNGVYPLP